MAPTPLRRIVSTAALLLALSVATPARADESPSAGNGPTVGIQPEMLFWIGDAEGKLIELAKAVPESKYSWSPDKGVRTFGEVFMHVAAANFGIPGFAGTIPPAGFRFEGYEHSLTKKDDIVRALKDSFAHMEGAFKAMTPEQLDTPAEFFGLKTTRRGAWMLLLSHAHEHLGQAIAYARVNKITPPWTAREEAEAKAKKDASAPGTKKPQP
jgi:uncharacterized damage-inducible protein DinB